MRKARFATVATATITLWEREEGGKKCPAVTQAELAADFLQHRHNPRQALLRSLTFYMLTPSPAHYTSLALDSELDIYVLRTAVEE